MRFDRRRFLQSFLRVSAAAALVWPGRAARGESVPVPDIHRATRNTRLGAIGVRLPRLSAPPAPSKPYGDRARLGLPVPSVRLEPALSAVVGAAPPAPGFAQQALGLAELSRLLLLTNGVTRNGGRRPLRAAPSAGALYAGEVYVAVGHVDGLEPATYYFDVAAHALVEVARADAAAVVQTLASGAAGAPAVAILLTNVFGRYTWRYANRGYRYALLDSGHIGENLRLAAQSAGLVHRLEPGFEDRALAALVGIDGREEAVCAVHLVGHPGRGPKRAPGRSLRERGAGVDAGASGSVIERYHAATALVPGAGDAAPPEPDPQLPDPQLPDGPGGDRIALPQPEHPLTSADESIRVRRSARRFEPRPLALADLARLLELGAARDPALHLRVVVSRVDGLTPGVYRYGPGHRLERIRAGAAGGALAQACLGQEKARTAAVGLVMVASLGPKGDVARRRAYRDRLLEAGAMGQRLYLAAEASGLAARNLAAYVDDQLDSLLRIDGTREAAVHLTVVGHGD